MKALVLAAVLAGVMVVAQAVELSEAEQESCKAEGGCALLTRTRMLQELQKAFELGQKDARAACARIL